MGDKIFQESDSATTVKKMIRVQKNYIIKRKKCSDYANT